MTRFRFFLYTCDFLLSYNSVEHFKSILIRDNPWIPDTSEVVLVRQCLDHAIVDLEFPNRDMNRIKLLNKSIVFVLSGKTYSVDSKNRIHAGL